MWLSLNRIREKLRFGAAGVCTHSPILSHPQGNLKHVNRLFSMLEATGLQPSLDSYAAALECMGRVPPPAKAVHR